MDYDKIVAGRRRNWDALKPDEVREKELEEKRAVQQAELEKKGSRLSGYHRFREHMMKQKAAADAAEFIRSRRQVFIVVGSFLAFFIFWNGIQFARDIWNRTTVVNNIAQLEVAIMSGKIINDLTTPEGALATWRSAWMNGAMGIVVESLSDKHVGRLMKSADRTRLTQDFRRQYDADLFNNTIDIASNFYGADPVKIPRTPWADGELAMFRSLPFQRIDEPDPGTRYIVMLAWDARRKSWRFADMREEDVVSVKWRYESNIQSMVAGPNALRYDESGNLKE